MKIANKKVRMQSPLVQPINDLERPLEKVLKKGKYIMIKSLNTPGDNDADPLKSTSPTSQTNNINRIGFQSSST